MVGFKLAASGYKNLLAMEWVSGTHSATYVTLRIIHVLL